MENFKEQVKKGFAACKSDIEELKEENSSLKQMLLETKNTNETLSIQLLELQSQIKGLTLALEYIKDTQQPTISTEHTTSPNKSPTLSLTQKSQTSERKPHNIPKDPYEALLAFKAKANKREMLKQKLISMIGESGMNLSELKFMFVEHFKYCSKATFYNYLKELELEKTIRIERENTKNFVYLYSMRKEI